MTFEEIRETFSLLEDWEDRYSYLIELGRELPAFPENEKTAANKVHGCVSEVWIAYHIQASEKPVIIYSGDSDALIVKGLVAVILAIFSHKTPSEIIDTNAEAILSQLDLRDQLTPQRSNGLSALIKRIQAIAEKEASNS